MSLYSALHAGVSGLGAQASAMATVADNITNVNTIGYKGVDAQFRTLVTDGRNTSSYVAGGVAAAPRALISKQGLLQIASAPTDLGIDGAGFFVTRSKADETGSVGFTRAGSFRPDDAGFLRNANGDYLQGWRLDANGAYVNNGSVTALEAVRLSDLSGTARPTSTVAMRANLQSETVAASGYAVGDMASSTTAPHFARSLEIFDAQGSGHRVTASFLKTAANQWAVEFHADPPGDVTAPGGLLASGNLAFNPDGSLNVAGSSPALFSPIAVSWTNGAGAAPLTLDLGGEGSISGITQFGSESALLSSSVNGGLLGNVATIEVSDDGVVSAVFEDGSSRAVFQLPLATFPNPDGLTRLNGNSYSTSADSGAFALNAPTVLGTGAIASGVLEASTVDLAKEFSDMIRFQRAYSAASKIITTVDDMLAEASNLKR